jgi:hypothetical protein
MCCESFKKATRKATSKGSGKKHLVKNVVRNLENFPVLTYPGESVDRKHWPDSLTSQVGMSESSIGLAFGAYGY